MEVKASLKHARIGVIKARPVADLIRGKNVNEAIKVLTFTNRKGARMMRKLIESAVANAEQKQSIDVDSLFVKTVTVDQGPSMKRFMPRARGSASVIRKKMSHINVVLSER